MTPEALAALHAACFTLPRPWSAPEIAALIADPLVFLIALPEGFIMGRAVLDEAELLTLAVAPQAQRRGLGRQLLAAFEDEARARGAATAFLEVAEPNTAARALYASAGYAQTGRRPRYYTGPGGLTQDALILSRPLDAAAAPTPPPVF